MASLAATSSAVSSGAEAGSTTVGTSAGSSSLTVATSASSLAKSSASAILAASASEALLISIRQPVSFAASLTFCPSLPMANESCLSGTTTVATSSLSPTLNTWAGPRALVIKAETSGLQAITSIFSPFSSFTIFCILMPRSPTQQPTGSTPS